MSQQQSTEGVLPCGCRITRQADASQEHAITFCPLHGAAPKLLQALEELLPWIERGRERFDREQARTLTQALAAIREATGQP
jgi:hypothetical protein